MFGLCSAFEACSPKARLEKHASPCFYAPCLGVNAAKLCSSALQSKMCPRAGDITNTIMLLCCTKTSSANPEKQDISVRLHHNLQWSSPRVNTGNTSSHPQKQRKKKIPFHQNKHISHCTPNQDIRLSKSFDPSIRKV